VSFLIAAVAKLLAAISMRDFNPCPEAGREDDLRSEVEEKEGLGEETGGTRERR